MEKRLRPRFTYANVIATLALFLALGGATAYAASTLGKNSVGSKQLKRNAVTGAKVKDGSLSARDFRAGALPRGERGATGERGPTGGRGPQGVAAAPGATSVVVRYGERTGLKDPGEVGQSLATCEPGESLTGGGFDVDGEPEPVEAPDYISPYTLMVDRPGGEGFEGEEELVFPDPVNGAAANSWTVVLRNELDPTIFFRAYAMCARP
jgi:hypothetical protein